MWLFIIASQRTLLEICFCVLYVVLRLLFLASALFFLGDEVAKPCASCGVVDTSLDCMHQRTVKSRGAIGAGHMMQPAPRSLLSTMSYFV